MQSRQIIFFNEPGIRPEHSESGSLRLLFCFAFLLFGFLGRTRVGGALYIAIIACPIANLALMLLGTITAFVVRRLHPEAKLGQMITTAMSLPPIGAVVTLVVTFTFDLHGC